MAASNPSRSYHPLARRAPSTRATMPACATPTRDPSSSACCSTLRCVGTVSALSASAHVTCTRCSMTPSTRLLSDTGARRGRPPRARRGVRLHRHLPPQVGVRDRAAGCAAAALARVPRGWWRRQDRKSVV